MLLSCKIHVNFHLKSIFYNDQKLFAIHYFGKLLKYEKNKVIAFTFGIDLTHNFI